MIITYITEPTVYKNEVAFDLPQQHQVAEQMVAAHALRVIVNQNRSAAYCVLNLYTTDYSA